MTLSPFQVSSSALVKQIFVNSTRPFMEEIVPTEYSYHIVKITTDNMVVTIDDNGVTIKYNGMTQFLNKGEFGSGRELQYKLTNELVSIVR